LRVGDRALLRDPGSRRLWGVVVLDPDPPPLTRRGAARARATALAEHLPGQLEDEVRLRGLVHVDRLRKLGVDAKGDGWLVDRAHSEALTTRLRALVDPHPGGLPVATCAARLDVPVDVVRSLVSAPMRIVEGRITTAEPTTDEVPADVLAAVEALRTELLDSPFAAPAADRIRELGLDARVVALAARAGLLLRVGDGIVLDHDADVRAAEVLATLPQPFTTSEARQALHTSRRVVLPLLAHLDRRGLTRRLPDDRRVSGSGSRR
jgi:selenocysteine-specific elongation factor